MTLLAGIMLYAIGIYTGFKMGHKWTYLEIEKRVNKIENSLTHVHSHQ